MVVKGEWCGVVVVVMMMIVCGGVGALRCYNCNNCIKYEHSQSQSCDQNDNRCMKLHMETGQVQRRCGTESMCANGAAELKTRYKEVHCCSDDNCNSAPTILPSPLPLLLLSLLPSAIAAAVRSLLLIHC